MKTEKLDKAVSDLIIVRTEVFEMTEDDMGEANDDGEDQNHESKHWCWSFKTLKESREKNHIRETL